MIREFLANVTGYRGLFFMCAVSGIVIPLPEDFPLMYAGVRIHDGEMAWLPAIAVAIVGVCVRDVIAWAVGARLGTWVLETRWARVMIGVGRIERARMAVTSHGALAVLLGRFFIGFRASMFLVAGAMRVPLAQFVFWDLVGLVVAVPATLALGYLFGDWIADLMFWALQRLRVVVGVSVVLGGAYLWWRLRRDRQRAEELG